MATGDLNGDGHLDAVTANVQDSTITVLLGDGHGSFLSSIDYTAGASACGVEIADFNRDGYLDVAVTNYNANSISILLGNGDGTLRPKTDFTVGANPITLMTADFNGDGKADLAISNDGGNSLTILLGKGDGTFTTKATLKPGNYPDCSAAGDFNGDGKTDLAVANYGGDTVTILLGKGDGTFTTKATLSTGSAPIALAIADFNGDNKSDLATANYYGNSISVFLGVGDGTFQGQPTLTTGGYPTAILAADFSGDGKVDLVVANGADGNLTTYAGHNDGTFTANPNVKLDSNPYSLAGGDFDSDGQPDLIVAYYEVSGARILLDQSQSLALSSFYPMTVGQVGWFSGTADGQASTLVQRITGTTTVGGVDAYEMTYGGPLLDPLAGLGYLATDTSLGLRLLGQTTLDDTGAVAATEEYSSLTLLPTVFAIGHTYNFSSPLAGSDTGGHAWTGTFSGTTTIVGTQILGTSTMAIVVEIDYTRFLSSAWGAETDTGVVTLELVAGLGIGQQTAAIHRVVTPAGLSDETSDLSRTYSLVSVQQLTTAFGASSADFGSIAYWRAGSGVTRTYAGQGADAGQTLTVATTTGQMLGVNCLIITRSEPGGSEVFWTALDSTGDAWLFRYDKDGSTVWQAGALSEVRPFVEADDPWLRMIGSGGLASGSTWTESDGSVDLVTDTAATLDAYPSLTFTQIKRTDGATVQWYYFESSCGLVLHLTDSGDTPAPATDTGWQYTGPVAAVVSHETVTGNSTTIYADSLVPSRTNYTDFAQTNTGGTVSRTYTLGDTGTANLVIGGVTLGGPNASDFTVTVQPTSTIAAAGTSTFIITFHPSTAGLKTATVTIASNDPAHPLYSFAIQGQGVSGTTLADGLFIGTTQAGAGDLAAENGQYLSVYYTGYLLDGTVFDASTLHTPLTPLSFAIGGGSLIAGWEEGLLGMKVGEKRTLVIPPALGYGTAGSGSIPPNATLIFEVELLAVSGPTARITGRGQTIPNGDTTPGTADDTAFGSLVLGHTVTHTFTISNSLTVGYVVAGPAALSGPQAGQFQITQPVASGSVYTFTVIYAPTALGDAAATVTIHTNDPVTPDITFSVSGSALGPDLEGTYGPITIPAPATAGDTFSVPVVITNGGTYLASGSITVTLQASADGQWHDDGVTLASRTQSVSVAAGGSTTVTLTALVPAGLSAGTYYLVAKIDSSTIIEPAGATPDLVTQAPRGYRPVIQVVSPLADLVVSLGDLLPSLPAYTPGDVLTLPVTITNLGVRPAVGSAAAPIVIEVRASADDAFSGGDALLGTILLTTALGRGQTTTATASFTLPISLPTGDYYIVAGADTTHLVTELDETNNTAASAEPFTYAWLFGSVPGRSGSTALSFTDTDGTRVRITLTGGGYGTLTQSGDGYDIDIVGSSLDSDIRITTTLGGTPGDDGRFTLHNLTVGDPDDAGDHTALGSLRAATTDLTGNLRIAGPARAIILGNVPGSSLIYIGGLVSSPAVSLMLGNVAGADLEVVGGISILTAGQWLGGSIAANSLATLKIAGNSSADLTLAGQDLPGGTKTLAAVTVGGNASGTWDVTGVIGIVTVKGTAADWTLDSSSLTGLRLGRLAVGGWIRNCEVRTTGAIGSIVAGGLDGSLIFAGVKDSVTALPALRTDFLAIADSLLPSIGRLTVRGIAGEASSYIGSDVAAWKIGTIRLRDVAVDNTAGGHQPFGVAASALMSYTRTATLPASVYRWSYSASDPWPDDATVDYVVLQVVA